MLPTRNFTTHFRRPEAIDISAATTPSTVVDIFTGVWKKFLITLNQRRVDRNQKGAKSSSYSPPWPASSGGTTEVKFQSIWQTVLSLTPPESRRWEEWQHKVPINCLTYFMLLFLATWDSSKQTDEAKYFRISKTAHRITTFKMPAIANQQPRLPSLLHRVRRFLLSSL